MYVIRSIEELPRIPGPRPKTGNFTGSAACHGPYTPLGGGWLQSGGGRRLSEAGVFAVRACRLGWLHQGHVECVWLAMPSEVPS